MNTMTSKASETGEKTVDALIRGLARPIGRGWAGKSREAIRATFLGRGEGKAILDKGLALWGFQRPAMQAEVEELVYWIGVASQD